MDDVTIRTAERKTAPAAVALLEAQLREHELAPSEALRAVVDAVISEPRHGFILLARSAADFVGIAYAAAHLSAEHGGIIGWLEELYVVPGSRSGGVGSFLLEEVIERAQQLAWRGLELEIVAGHERAVSLYQRHGFASLSRARFTKLFAAAAPHRHG